MRRFLRRRPEPEAPPEPPAPRRPNWKSELHAELSLNDVEASLLRAGEAERAPANLPSSGVPATQAEYEELLEAVYGGARERFVGVVSQNAYVNAAIANWNRLDTLRRQQRVQLLAMELSNALGACYGFTPKPIRFASGLQAFIGVRGVHLTPAHANLPLPLLARAILQGQLEALQATLIAAARQSTDPMQRRLAAAWAAGYGFATAEATRLARALSVEYGWPLTVL
ncbi:MAG TPA: hypothetical protein V6D47_04570 [Oscillatoriaceae cyanobacterium]